MKNCNHTNLIFLGNNSDYSYRVLETICQRELLPKVVALPYYGSQQRFDSSFRIEAEHSAGKTAFVCQTYQIPIIYSPNNDQVTIGDYLHNHSTDFLVIACWPRILPQNIYTAARCKAMNLHPSLLPAYPGIDPFGAQVKRKVKRSGVTLHLLNENFDQGEIVAQRSFDCNYTNLKESQSRHNMENQAAEKAGQMLLNYFS